MKRSKPVALALCGGLAACKIEPIEELEDVEPVTIELPGTVQPLAGPPAEPEGRPTSDGAAELEQMPPREVMVAIGRDVVLPWWLLWRSFEPVEAPQVVVEQPPMP